MQWQLSLLRLHKGTGLPKGCSQRVASLSWHSQTYLYHIVSYSDHEVLPTRDL